MRWNVRQYYNCVSDMREKGYSVKEIALACGVTPQSIHNLLNTDIMDLTEIIIQEETEWSLVHRTAPVVEQLIADGYSKDEIMEITGMSFEELRHIAVLKKKIEVKRLQYVMNPLADKIWDMRAKGISIMNIHKEIGISYKRVKEIMELEGIS